MHRSRASFFFRVTQRSVLADVVTRSLRGFTSDHRGGGADSSWVAHRLAAVGVVAGLVLSLASCKPAGPPTADVTLYGDSISVDSNIPIANAITGAGLTYASHVYGGQALCDQLGQMQKDSTTTPKPKVVVVAYNGNNVTACMQRADGTPLIGEDLREKYYADLETVHDIWALQGIPVVLLGALAMSPDNTAGFDQPDHLAFDQMLQQAASDFGFTYEDTTPDISPGNVFVSTLPCAPYESVEQGTCTGPIIDGVQNNIVRSSDGLHLCPNATGVPSSVTPDCPVYASGEVRWARHVLHGVQTVVPADTTTTTTSVPDTTTEVPDTTDRR